MSQQTLQKEPVTLNKKQYSVLLKMYHSCTDEYTKFDVQKFFTDEERKSVHALVNKNLAIYSDNTNKVQVSLNGFNSIANPPGLTRAEQNEVCHQFMKPSKPPVSVERIRNSADQKSDKSATRSTYQSKPKTGESKKDMVARFLDKGQNPQQIFDSMAKEGVQTTVGSVRCFIKTINEERAAAPKGSKKK